MKDMFSVKDASRLCNLSRRQLLYYEETGLIGEVIRDSSNNYRYYSRDQIFLLNYIRELRSLGFDFSELKNMIRDEAVQSLRNSIQKRISHTQEEMEIALSNYNKRLTSLVKMLEATWIVEASKGFMASDLIEIIDVPEKNTLAYDYIGYFYEEEFEFLRKFKVLDDEIDRLQVTKLSNQQLTCTGHYNAEQGVFLMEQNKITLFYEIKEGDCWSSFFRVMPGFRAVSAINIGNYEEDLTETYKKLFVWAKKNSYKLSSTSYEENILDLSSTLNSEIWVTRVYIPFCEF